MTVTPQQLAEHDIHCFIETYGIKDEKGVPLDFKNHMFLWDIYADPSPYIAILKPPQIGATDTMIIKALWTAKNHKKDIIYTLPTQADVSDMGGGKVNRIIAQNPILKEWVKDHDSIEQKNVGNNIIYFRGTFTNKQAMMVSSSLNIHDEVDASKPDVIEQYETRLMANPEDSRWRWYFSHPTLVGLGIHKFFLLSDQKHWFITCHHCKHRQYMSWDTTDPVKMSVDLVKEIFICKQCKGELSDDDRRYGVWAKRFNDGRQFSGYWISQLMCSWISAKKICKDFKEKTPEYFHNYVLGLPFAGSGNQVTAEVIDRNIIDRVNDRDGQIIIGVDSGLPIWVVVGNMKGIFYWGSCKTWAEIESLMTRWPNSVVVADQGGDLIGIRSLQEKYPNRVFLVFYRKDRKAQSIIKWGEGDEFGSVVVDRNRAIQLAVEQFVERRIPLYGSKADYHEYTTHWLNIYREWETDDKGEIDKAKGFTWKRSGPDHLVHSTVYYLVGLDKFKEGGVAFFEPGNPRLEVGTPGIEVFPDQTTVAPKIIRV